MKRYLVICISFFFLVFFSCSQSPTVPSYLENYQDEYEKNPRDANLQWFKDAGFGMFIHYGLYSILGKGEWVQLRDTIPLNEYVLLKQEFTAENFDSEAIIALAKKAGMKYITITSKHHEGFCLFNTDQTDYNSLSAPCGRDLIGELYEACNNHNMGLFLYYSYATDWYHPWFYNREDGWMHGRPAYLDRPAQYKYKKPGDFKKYIDFVHAQLRELLNQYPNIAGIWFDPIMGYYSNPELFPIEETYKLIRELSPHALISFKQGANGTEDFVAPERQGKAKAGFRFEVAKRVYELNKDKPKEVCNTMQPHLPGIHGGATWGYNKAMDGYHLNTQEVYHLLLEAKRNNYNLLLNVGPLPDGSIHHEDVKALSELKDLMKSKE